jgi:hypothetical protein
MAEHPSICFKARALKSIVSLTVNLPEWNELATADGPAYLYEIQVHLNQGRKGNYLYGFRRSGSWMLNVKPWPSTFVADILMSMSAWGSTH